MKTYTDISQSKKLAEILPHNTADGTWKRVAIAGINLDVPEEQQYFHDGDTPFVYYSGVGLPSWSLAALLEQLDDNITNDDGNDLLLEIHKEDGLYYLNYHDRWEWQDDIETDYYDDLVDACVEMIEKLHEQKPKWTDEDDYNVHCCIAKVENDIANGYPGRNYELIEWLKSIKQRIGE